MTRVPVCRAGRVVAHALVDDCDRERVLALRWRLYDRYAETKIGGRSVMLHRFVLGLEPGDGREIDHMSRDRLDCTRGNLRIATRAQNAQNVRARGGSSRFRGVSWERSKHRWQVTLGIAGRQVKVGYHTEEVQAALMAHEARARLLPFAMPDPELVKLGLVAV